EVRAAHPQLRTAMLCGLAGVKDKFKRVEVYAPVDHDEHGIAYERGTYRPGWGLAVAVDYSKVRALAQAALCARGRERLAASAAAHIEAACPQCAARYRLKAESAGLRARCGKCGKVFRVAKP